jgi:hypothetical protein
MTLNNRSCNQVRLPNLPLSSDSSRRNAMKTEAVVKNLICNGNVLYATAHWHTCHFSVTDVLGLGVTYVLVSYRAQKSPEVLRLPGVCC